MSSYQRTIQNHLNRIFVGGIYSPRHIEALMRLDRPTLDHLSMEEFRGAIEEAASAARLFKPADLEAIAESFGL